MESWLNSSICTNGIFLAIIKCFARTDGFGGVFFACHNNFFCTLIDVSTSCEAIAYKIDVLRNGRLIVLTVCRPPNSDREYMHNLCQLTNIWTT